jgi:predicted SAM-dependent methyltransferase
VANKVPAMERLLKAAGERSRVAALARLGAAAESRRLLCSVRYPMKLHLGCGRRVLKGWLNVDMQHRPGVVAMRLPDGLSRFPDRSASFVYSSHMVEHIDYPDAVHRLATEILRILTPGGVFRMVVPGIERIIRAYVADDDAFFARQAERHPPSCTTRLEHLMYALQQHGEHKFGYDFETAEKFLRRAGYARIINSDFNASEFPELRIDYRGKDLSLFVEAVK